MAGTAQAADRIRCARCTGHYVVDSASDGSPRVRCNKCGHLREATEQPSPASVPGKWTVIGPDGKAMSFDSWEELTESRRPSAITPTAKGMEEADNTLRDLKPGQDKKSASALLDITPPPKLALAEMDSAIDLGEPVGRARSRPGASTMVSGSGTGSTPSGKLEPLLVRSFSQSPKTASQAPSKVEWAPKIDKASLTPRTDQDNTLRVEMAPAQIAAASGEKERGVPAPATAKVIEADRPTAPNGGVAAADDSIDELDPDSLLEDPDDEEESPLSLRDAIPDEEELGDDDLQEEDAPDPHDVLSLRDLVVAPAAGHADEKAAARAKTPSIAPPKPQSVAPPKATSLSPAAKAASVPPPRPKSLSRPDVPEGSLPPPTIQIDDTPDKAEEDKSSRAAVTVRPPGPRRKPKDEAKGRTWMWMALAGVLVLGVAWRLSQSPEPTPKPTPPIPTVAAPTPVTTPSPTHESPTPTTSVAILEPTPSGSSSGGAATNPSTSSGGATNPVVDHGNGSAANGTTPATTTEKKPVGTTAENGNGNGTATTASAEKPEKPEKKPTVANTDSPGSMSELLDKAGAAKRKGDLGTARELYGRVLAMSPNNVEANGGLGDVAKAQGDLGAAKASYERALAASPTYSPALLGLADVEWDQGNQASAKKRYAQIVDRLGDRAPARAKERSQ